MDKEPVVFMSYRHVDVENLARLVELLESQQIICRYAPRNFIAGEEYTERITEEIINHTDIMIVFITENTEASTHVLREINLALTYNKAILPVLFEIDKIPRRFELLLGINHWVPLTAEFHEGHLNNIIKSIEYRNSGSQGSQVFDKRASSITKIGDVAVYEIERKLVQQVQEQYINPPQYQLAKQLLNTHHCVVLQNQENVGKFTTAIHLLDSYGYEKIYMWPNTPTLKKVTKANIEQNVACIIEIDNINSFIQQVMDFEIAQWLEKLKASNSHFIFTLIDDSPELLSHFTVELSSPIEIEQLITKQLDTLNITDTKEINSLLNEMKSTGIIEPNILPKVAIKLSKEMANVLTEVTPKEIFLQSHMNKSIERIGKWFRESYSIESLSLFLVTAIFDGQRYTEIEFHSKELVQSFEKYEFLTTENTGLINLNEKFASFHAIIKESTNTSIKSSRTAHLIYSNDSFALWETIWYQYPQYRNPIMDWAISFLKKAAPWKQEKLIQILLELIKFDFYEGIFSIVYKLIKTNQRSFQLIAVEILEKLYDTEDFKYRTFQQVRLWMEQRKSEVVYETCLMALSTNIGKDNLAKTLQLILKMIHSNQDSANDFKIQNLLSNLMNLMRVNDIYADSIILFWKKCSQLSSNTFDFYSFALNIFKARQHLIVLSNNRNIKVFWTEIIGRCYVNPTTREATLKLIGSLMDQTRHLKHYPSVARLIVYLHKWLNKNQYLNEWTYFTKFIDLKSDYMSKNGFTELSQQIDQLLNTNKKEVK